MDKSDEKQLQQVEESPEEVLRQNAQRATLKKISN